MACRPPIGDHTLIQIVDAALAEAGRKSGDWLVCRPSCCQCCVGVFAINQLDTARLKAGLVELEMREPESAHRIRERARASVRRLSPVFPGEMRTGILNDNEDVRAEFLDSELAENEPCPVLNPETGTCDLYESRPMTCRVFGPPVQSEDGLGVCELCYYGATEEQIAECEMKPDPDDLESKLNEEAEKAAGARGDTIVAGVFCSD